MTRFSPDRRKLSTLNRFRLSGNGFSRSFFERFARNNETYYDDRTIYVTDALKTTKTKRRIFRFAS